jgi:hypothetical protein
MFLMRLNCNKVKYYTENHTFAILLEAITNWRWKSVGNYRVNQNQIDGIKNSGVGGDLNVNDIPQDAQVLNYNGITSCLFWNKSRYLFGLCGRFMVGY